MCTCALIIAGITVLPVRSTCAAPAGTATAPFRPTAVMRPFCTTKAPFSIGGRAIADDQPRAFVHRGAAGRLRKCDRGCEGDERDGGARRAALQHGRGRRKSSHD
jgi:hypothetical protein